MTKMIAKLVRDEEGGTAAEYGIIVGIIALALVALIATFKGKLTNLFNQVP